MKIAVENGYIQILSLQFPGKRRWQHLNFKRNLIFYGRRSTDLNK
jgi:hypothetical protein